MQKKDGMIQGLVGHDYNWSARFIRLGKRRKVEVSGGYAFFSETRIAKTMTTIKPMTKEMPNTVKRATGNLPFVSADWMVKYRVQPGFRGRRQFEQTWGK